MGVMNCSRKNCGHIMCDTYVESIGYICSECNLEFKEYLKNNGLNPTTEGQINRELEKFMITTKYDNNETDVESFVNERTQ